MNDHPREPGREFTEDEARAFWQEARAKVQRGDCNFRGAVFPQDPHGKGFTEATFDGDADFHLAVFRGTAGFAGAVLRGARI